MRAFPRPSDSGGTGVGTDKSHTFRPGWSRSVPPAPHRSEGHQLIKELPSRFYYGFIEMGTPPQKLVSNLSRSPRSCQLTVPASRSTSTPEVQTSGFLGSSMHVSRASPRPSSSSAKLLKVLPLQASRRPSTLRRRRPTQTLSHPLRLPTDRALLSAQWPPTAFRSPA